MAIKYIYQYFPIQGTPKFTQIGISGLKINYLATLKQSLKMVHRALGKNSGSGLLVPDARFAWQISTRPKAWRP
jgi:hypothetical protein